jgi:predicted nuclease with TOPRIM domain
MFRFISKMPHGEIKIAHPCGICFEGEVGAITEVAVKVGEAAASVENLEEKTEELEQKTEQLEQEQLWNNDRFSRMWDEIWQLRDEVNALTQKLEALETVAEVAAEEPETETPAGTEASETVIEGTDNTTSETSTESTTPKTTTKWGIGL